MGASLYEATRAIKKLIPADYRPSKSSHPARYARLIAVENGYFKAKYFDKANYNEAWPGITRQNLNNEIIKEENKLKKLLNNNIFKYYDEHEKKQREYANLRNENYHVTNQHIIGKIMYSKEIDNNIPDEYSTVYIPITDIKLIESRYYDEAIAIYTKGNSIIDERKNAASGIVSKTVKNNIWLSLDHFSNQDLHEEICKCIKKLKIMYNTVR